MSSAEADMIHVVEDLIGLDPQMRFAAVIDLDGAIVEAIMKEGKTSLESQQEEAHFCRQVAERRRMRSGFDDSLGGVQYVHVERERVTQMVIYTPRYTVYFVMEPELAMEDKLEIIARAKEISSGL